MSITFPGESADYRTARARLLDEEIELRRAMERVTAARRELPPGGAVPEDYLFEGAGPSGGDRSSSMPPPTPARIPAISALSSRSGTASTSPRRVARPTGRSS
jgi:Bacterial protein of unknown function (DUF899)